MAKRHIVTIGGGSGQYILLKALKKISNISITSVVSMVDSGGSTGVLRDQYGALPPGDILKCLIALSPLKDARTILQTRFKNNSHLKNHNAGNLLLTFLTDHTHGNFPAAVEALSEILHITDYVLPVTTDKATLVAKLSNGKRIYGEAAIDTPRGMRNEKIVSAYLVPHHGKLTVYKEVLKAIEQADSIIIGPGDLYTSIVPNLLLSEVPKAIDNNKSAKLLYIANLMTKYGETHSFSLEDFIDVLEQYIDKNIDHIVINNRPLHKNLKKEYEKQKAWVIEPPSKADARYCITDLLSEEGGLARHNQEKLAKAISKLL